MFGLNGTYGSLKKVNAPGISNLKEYKADWQLTGHRF